MLREIGPLLSDSDLHNRRRIYWLAFFLLPTRHARPVGLLANDQVKVGALSIAGKGSVRKRRRTHQGELSRI